MSVGIIEKLLSAGASVTGKVLRVIAGQDPTGNAQALLTDVDGNLKVVQSTEGASADAVGRLRTSAPFGLYEVTHQFDKMPNLMVEKVVGGATSVHVAAESSVDMTVSNTGDRVYRRSKIWVPYQPGRGQNILATGVFGAGATGIEKRVGYFEETALGGDGCYFQQNGPASTDYQVVVRSTTAKGTTSVPRASWDDPLDGSGPSGATVDLSDGAVFIVDLLWLGYDKVRFAVKAGGETYTAHVTSFAPLSGPYMRSGALPLAYEIHNVSGGAVSRTLRQTCMSAFAEGGYDPVGQSGASVLTNGFNLSGAGSTALVTSIRLKSAYKKGVIVPIGFSSVSEDNKINLIELVIGGTLAGNLTGWTSISQGVEENKWSGAGAAPTLTGGRRIFVAQSSSGNTGESLGLNIRDLPGLNSSDLPETLSVRVTRIQSGHSNYTGTLNFQEVY